MKDNLNDPSQIEFKKEWKTPEVVSYGDVAEITRQTIKDKTLGFQDDFGVTGIEDPS